MTSKQAGEIIVEDPQTGGKKAAQLARFSLIPPHVEWALAEHYGRGALKYEDRNWEKGYRWSLSLDALRRHLNKWTRGFSVDEETGSHHLIAVIWHAVALYEFERLNKGTDDLNRPFLSKERYEAIYRD